MKTSSAKAKGRRLQAEIKEAIHQTFPDLEDSEIKCAIMGESGCDLHLSAKAHEVFPYAVEAKNVERLNVWDALNQAADNAKDDTTPLLVIRRNRTIPYAIVPLDHFMKLVGPQHEQD